MLIKNPTIEKICSSIENLDNSEGQTVMLFFGEKADIDYLLLIQELNHRQISFIGGIFPGIIHGNEQVLDGCLIKTMKLKGQPFLIRSLQMFHEITPQILDLVNQSKKKLTAFTLVDGLTDNISTYLTTLHNYLGNGVNFIGGGAGSLSLKQMPCLLTNEGFFEDAALLCFLDYNIGLGVKHGWEKLYGPMVATRTDRNRIIELNWENALEAYQKILVEDGNPALEKDNFFSIAKGYPFGMYKEENEDIVRDPISYDEDGALICVGEVPENTVLYILKGETQNLIKAAKEATTDSLENITTKLKHTLVVDCISRTLFLEQHFTDELVQITEGIQNYDDEIIPQGILSLGEISSYGEGYLEFFNKTIVIGSLFE